MDVPEDVIE